MAVVEEEKKKPQKKMKKRLEIWKVHWTSPPNTIEVEEGFNPFQFRKRENQDPHQLDQQLLLFFYFLIN